MKSRSCSTAVSLSLLLTYFLNVDSFLLKTGYECPSKSLKASTCSFRGSEPNHFQFKRVPDNRYSMVWAETNSQQSYMEPFSLVSSRRALIGAFGFCASLISLPVSTFANEAQDGNLLLPVSGTYFPKETPDTWIW